MNLNKPHKIYKQTKNKIKKIIKKKLKKLLI